MTKLTNDIKQAIDKVSIFDEKTEGLLTDIHEALATAAAEVCKGYIERAFDAGQFAGNTMAQVLSKQTALTKEEWLKSEGITE